MKRFLRSKFVLSLAALIMIGAAVIIPLSGSIAHSHAAAQIKPRQCSPGKLCSLTVVSSPNSGGSSSVTLNPSEAPPNASVTGVGSNWASGDTILVQWEDGTTLANTTVQSNGTFTVPFIVPSNATQGAHTVYFTDQTASYFIPATLTVGTCPSSSLTVQSAFTQDGNGNANSIFAQGSSIQYVVIVNNSCGSTINAMFQFQDFWGTINDYPLEIFDSIYQNITLPVGLSGWYVPTTVPTTALPGSFTHEVFVADMNGNQNQGTGYGSFMVTGNTLLNRNGKPVPYDTQYKGQYAQNFDCGPASVAMALSYYGRGPGGSGTALTQIRKAATGKDTRTDTNATQLEKALSHYGSSWTEIPRTIPNLPNPDAQLTDMAAAIEQEQPVIGFIDAFDFHRSYNGHWLVVVGFRNDGTNTYVILNDPDNQAKRKGYPNWIVGGPDISVLLSTFSQAEYDAQSGPYGIVVTS
jgi:hypothetical protein